MMLVSVPESNANALGSLVNDLKDITTNVIETTNPDVISATPRIVCKY